jgi:hypothetical protein
MYVMVDIVKGGGHAPPPSLAWANFSIMMEYTPESGHCRSVCYSVGASMPWGNAEIHAVDQKVWTIEEARRRKAS